MMAINAAILTAATAVAQALEWLVIVWLRRLSWQHLMHQPIAFWHTVLADRWECCCFCDLSAGATPERSHTPTVCGPLWPKTGMEGETAAAAACSGL
jgi:hypothetical protein